MSVDHSDSSSQDASAWQEARAFLRAGDETRAIALFRQLAEGGDWRASASLGYIFEGRGPKDRAHYIEAAHWYNNALSKEDRPELHLALARYYYYGLNGERDLKLAYEHLSRSRPELNPEAALMLAELLYLGLGAAPDIHRAKQLLLSAISAGYPYGMLRMARVARGEGRHLTFLLLLLRGLITAIRLSWKNDSDPRLIGMAGRHGRLVLEGVTGQSGTTGRE